MRSARQAEPGGGGVGLLVAFWIMAGFSVGATACGPQRSIDRAEDLSGDAALGAGVAQQDSGDQPQPVPSGAGPDLGGGEAGDAVASWPADGPPAPEVAAWRPPDVAGQVAPGADAAAAAADGASASGPVPLVVRSGAASEESDLTALGALDWVHWGEGDNEPALNRKAGVAARITWELLGGGAVAAYRDRPVRVAWRDGTPVARDRTREGIATGGRVGRGFGLRISGPLPMGGRLWLQLGAWNARAQLQVEIWPRSGPGHRDRDLEAAHPGRDRLTSLDFGPLSADQTLVVEWTVAELRAEYGNVTLQAAALSPAAPPGDGGGEGP